MTELEELKKKADVAFSAYAHTAAEAASAAHAASYIKSKKGMCKQTETLSDKIYSGSRLTKYHKYFWKEDVREAVKKLKYWINNEGGQSKYFMSLGIDKLKEKIKEIFGEKLT